MNLLTQTQVDTEGALVFFLLLSFFSIKAIANFRLGREHSCHSNSSPVDSSRSARGQLVNPNLNRTKMSYSLTSPSAWPAVITKPAHASTSPTGWHSKIKCVIFFSQNSGKYRVHSANTHWCIWVTPRTISISSAIVSRKTIADETKIVLGVYMGRTKLTNLYPWCKFKIY